MIDCEKMREALEKWTKPSHIQLHAGEMTAGELRSVIAVVEAIQCDLGALHEGPRRMTREEDNIWRAYLPFVHQFPYQYQPGLEKACEALRALRPHEDKP